MTTTLVFPFGKFQGRPISEADTQYLGWFAREVKNAPREVALAVLAEFLSRPDKDEVLHAKRPPQRAKEIAPALHPLVSMKPVTELVQ